MVQTQGCDLQLPGRPRPPVRRGAAAPARDLGHIKARARVAVEFGSLPPTQTVERHRPLRPSASVSRRGVTVLDGPHRLPWRGKALAQSADFRTLADMRVREAKLLLDGSEWSGAYYFIGYAVECGLKACLTKDLQAYQMPDREFSKAFIHDVAKLAQIAQLDGRRALNAQTDHDFALNCNVVTSWNEESRYTVWTETQAKELYEAVTNANHGVLPWLKTFW